MTNRSPRLTDLVIISGFSGAGKSTAMNVFEDAGYFCVDNLPPAMIVSLAELLTHAGSKVERAAVVCDVRSGEYFEQLLSTLTGLTKAGLIHRLLFLEADEQTLLNRYKETRRRHPLTPAGTVMQGVAAERQLLNGLRERAELVIDTTGLSVATARRKIAERALADLHPGKLAISFMSFGYKHGPPRDADLVFDVRFLPNPHYEVELRSRTGLEQGVVDFINAQGDLTELLEKLLPLIDYLLPKYEREGKAHLHIAIGCTGGRHRSVAITEEMAARYRDASSYNVETIHRDLDRQHSG